MYKVHFPVINTDWQKSPVPATDLAEIVFLKFQFLPIESIRLSGPPWTSKGKVCKAINAYFSHQILVVFFETIFMCIIQSSID
jgi:hypothetical protein